MLEIPPRQVHLIDACIHSYDWPLVDVELHTGKGFYVRSFARDLGGALGTGGHCVALRRTAVGPFGLASAVTLDVLPEQLSDHDLLSPATAAERVAAHQ